MSPARDGELELKLELTRDELRRVRSHPALGDLAVGEPVTRTVHSIYFDTPDHRLRAQGISLRLRSDGESWRQSVRSGAGVDHGGSDPVGAEAAVERPEPDLDRIGNRKIRRKLEKAVARSILEPVFETVVERTTRRLHSGEGELELALDEGLVRAGAAENALCEAELELKSGEPECLLETAARLFASAPVRLAGSSRAERGYSLALGRVNGHVVEPQRGVLPELRAGHTCAEAFGLIVRSAADQIAANRRAVLETVDPAAAHQLRIGLRRLRSALRAFRPLHDTQALRELEGHAQALARTVGDLRDADVLIEHIYAPVAGLIKADPGVPRVREALVAYRDRMRGRVRAALEGEQWSVLQLYLALWPRTIEDAPGLGRSVKKFARAALKRQWKKVADSGERLDALSVEQRHEMRKALKTLRYAVEFFASLYPEEQTRPFIKETRSLQEVFGYLNDVVAAGRLGAICHEACSDSREAQRTAGYVLGWHNAQAAHAWKDAHKGWLRLETLPQFWAT
jgi:inorganic triphosphatase YgiF